MDEAWTMPSWQAARPLSAADDRFRQLFADHGPAMNPAVVTDLSPLYLEALLRTNVPSWLRARLLGEQRRRRRAGWSERLRLRVRVLTMKYVRRRKVAGVQRLTCLR